MSWTESGGDEREGKGPKGNQREGPKHRKRWARRVGSPKHGAFFPSPAANFIILFSLRGSSRGIVVVI